MYVSTVNLYDVHYIYHQWSDIYVNFQNNIPVFCPAITDGSLGDMIYVHSYKNPGLIVDIAQGVLTL